MIIAVLAFGDRRLDALTYFLTDLVFQHFDLQPPPLLAVVIKSVLGLIMCFVLLTADRSLIGSKQREQRIGFQADSRAMRQIAQGDFSVRLDDEHFPEDARSASWCKASRHGGRTEADGAMRQEFISNVSHEIQSPLTSIRGFARALQNDRLSPSDRCHYLKIIETESMRLSKLTDNLLSWHRWKPKR